MDKKNKSPNVPNLRFKEFTESWVNYKVSELLTTIPTNSLSWNQLTHKPDSGIKNLHYGLIHNGFETTSITGDNKLIPYINPTFVPKKINLIQNGDLILADASEDRKDVGRPVEIISIENQKIVSGLHTIHAKNKTNLIVIGFKGFYFQSEAMKKQIFKIANGSKIFGIFATNFNELNMYIPSLHEQKIIVDLMTKIESRIQTQIKIINKYESLIKSIEEEILWKGSDSRYVPIKEFLVERNEKSTIQDQYPVLSSTVKGLFFQSDYFQREIASSNNIGYKITKLNDIIISPQNLWMGNITYNDKFENGIVSPSYHIYEIKDGYNKQYIASILKSYKAFYCYKTISEQGASVVRRNLNMDAFLNIMFPIPTKEKQDEAGVIIQQLHLKLDVENQYLNNLLSQKTYLLNNMFI